MEEVDMERLKAYAAGTLTAKERSAFELHCRSIDYDPKCYWKYWFSNKTLPVALPILMKTMPLNNSNSNSTNEVFRTNLALVRPQ